MPSSSTGRVVPLTTCASGVDVFAGFCNAAIMLMGLIIVILFVKRRISGKISAQRRIKYIVTHTYLIYS